MDEWRKGLLKRLRDANAILGKFMPDELKKLSFTEFNYMLAGAQQQELNRQRFSFMMTQVSRPALMVNKSVNVDKVSQMLKQQQADLDHFDNEEYQKQQELREQRQQQFGQFFSKFSRQNTQKGG